MGYFSNGSEGEVYEQKYCSRCVHQSDEEGCPVFMAHFMYNYDQKGDAEDILNMFIPREGISNKQCTMFVERK